MNNFVMRILLWMIDGDKIPGGHRIQIEQTAESLRDLGVEAEITFKNDISLEGIDVLHGFGLATEQIRSARISGVPVVLSTIYPGRDFKLGHHIDRRLADRWRFRLRTARYLASSVWSGNHVDACDQVVVPLNRLRMQYESADLLLPNSRLEASLIEAELGVTTPMHVVPNAVAPRHFRPGGEPGEGVLYVGRIEPHKNQLGLIRAMKRSGLPLTLVGDMHPHHPDYARRVERELRGRGRWVRGVVHNELGRVYRHHRVHVLPSWFETTGLVSLEAALCGLNVVSTRRGFAQEYFGEHAWYCDPASPRTICESVKAAYRAPVDPTLRKKILERYTWRHTAKATLQGYEIVAGKHGRVG